MIYLKVVQQLTPYIYLCGFRPCYIGLCEFKYLNFVVGFSLLFNHGEECIHVLKVLFNQAPIAVGRASDS